MLMESVALFTSDFFGSQPYATERHLTWQKVFAEQLCFQASATIVTAKLFSLWYQNYHFLTEKTNFWMTTPPKSDRLTITHRRTSPSFLMRNCLFYEKNPDRISSQLFWLTNHSTQKQHARLNNNNVNKSDRNLIATGRFIRFFDLHSQKRNGPELKISPKEVRGKISSFPGKFTCCMCLCMSHWKLDASGNCALNSKQSQLTQVKFMILFNCM